MAVDTADTGAGTVRHARATVRPEKATAVAEIAEAFRGSSAAVLTEYRGLTVSQISALRTALGADTTYSVVKNTLTRIAAADAGVTGVDALLEGPTAVAFIAGSRWPPRRCCATLPRPIRCSSSRAASWTAGR